MADRAHLKMWRDVTTGSGRALLMVASLATSLAGVGAVLGAYSVLTREMDRNYLATRPASATLDLDAVSRELVEEVQRRPAISEAEARRTVLARVQVGAERVPLLLFVVDDFEHLRLNVVHPERGAWPPPPRTMLLERTAAPFLRTGLGRSVAVKTPHGPTRDVTVSGIVHDPSLAPAWQERVGYAYVTHETLMWLGETGPLDQLRVEFVKDGAAGSEVQRIDAAARALAASLEEEGHTVHQIAVPPPGAHPHQAQMRAILAMMLAFGSLALVLSAILVANALAALLARQHREVAVMKTLGARPAQITRLYSLMIALLGTIAVVAAIAPAVITARLFARTVAALLNFDLQTENIPAWVFAVMFISGLLVPLAAALVPIRRASRSTIRAALDDHEVVIPPERRDRTCVSRIGERNRTLALGLRNAVRRRGRLALSVTMLAAAGAMFMMSLNVKRAWEVSVDQVARTRQYHVEFRYGPQEDGIDAERVARTVPGVQTVERWAYARTAIFRSGELDVVRAYPDGGHGSFTIYAPPASSRLVRFPLIRGRWLETEDVDAVVLNQLAAAQVPDIAVGDPLTLSVEGRPTTWRVVGIVEEIGGAAAAYVSHAGFARAVPMPNREEMMRVATRDLEEGERLEVLRILERSLEDAGVGVYAVIRVSDLSAAVGDHVLILIRLLLAMAILIAVVGMLGLASSLGISVVERTRELGIMKAIGATPGTVITLIIGEGLIVGLLSVLPALVLSVPLTAAVGSLLGSLAWKLPLPLALSLPAAVVWGGIVLAVSVAASVVPARRAAQLNVRNALSHV